MTWSIRPSRASVAWIWLSTTPRLKGRAGLVTEQTAESYAATFDTNVLGTLVEHEA